MSSVTQAYGPNIAFIEELYEKYRTNPESVSASWREFFADYQPVFEEEHEAQVAASGGAAHISAPDSGLKPASTQKQKRCFTRLRSCC